MIQKWSKFFVFAFFDSESSNSRQKTIKKISTTFWVSDPLGLSHFKAENCKILRLAQCFGPFSICLHFVHYYIWSIFYMLEYHQVWHTMNCFEHRMYHLHKVKLCRARTVNLALFLCLLILNKCIMDDFHIFEVK